MLAAPEAHARPEPLQALAWLLLVLPWLNPLAPGPTPTVIPWLFTLGCSAALLAIANARTLRTITPQAWLGAALLSAVLGLLQYAGLVDAWAPWVNHAAVGEAYANLRQRNQFATLTNIGLAALLWGVAQGRGGFWVRAVLGAGAAMLLGLGNVASSSRTGLAQLFVLLVLAWLWRDTAVRAPGQRPVAALLGLAALAYGVGAWGLPQALGLDPHSVGILARLQDGAPACTSRLTLWSNVLHLISLKPWAGWGWGELEYAHFITLYPGERFCDILDNAHNLPLHLAVELGLPAAALLCGLAAWLVWRARPWAESQPLRRMAWAVLAVLALHSLLEYPLWYGPFQVACALSLWLLFQPASGQSLQNSTNTPKRRIWQAWVAMILLAFCAYAGWDYQRVSQIYLPPDERLAGYRENTLAKISGSRLFADQVRFAELNVMVLGPENAGYVYALAHRVLHFSAEARVAEMLIESATLLGRDAEAQYFLARYRAAFAQEHARWVQDRLR